MKNRSEKLHVAVVDIGSSRNIGWAICGPEFNCCGTDIDKGIGWFSSALACGPLALGFEAPMFVPIREDAESLTKPRNGEGNRPFSAAAGATVLVAGLVLVPYILSKLRKSRSENGGANPVAWQDWSRIPAEKDQMLVFEAFVSNVKAPRGPINRHVDDARRAVEKFRADFSVPASAICETRIFSTLGALLLFTEWTTDQGEICRPCLVVKA